MLTLTGFIGDINTRLKRLETAIGSATDRVLQFMAISEKMAVTDYVYVYSKTMNDSFLVGRGIIGVTEIGDRSDMEVLVYEGDGS